MSKRLCYASFNLLIFSTFFFLTRNINAQNGGSLVAASSIGFSPRLELSCCAVNGKIYAIGGNNFVDTTAPKKIEIFDPKSNSWTAPTVQGNIPSLINHTSTVVNDKIYLIGGNGKHEINIFDPATNTLTTPTTSGDFIWRTAHTCAEVNGKIYVIGGDSGYLNTVATLQVFDPQTNAWSTPTTSGNFTPRAYLVSTVVNGKIYVLGGENDSGQQLNTLEVFDPTTNTWSSPATTGIFGAKSIATGLGCGLINGKIYVTGSTSTVEVFDPTTNIWSSLVPSGSFMSRIEYGSAVEDGKLFILGGMKAKIGALNTNQFFTPPSSGVGIKKTESNISFYPNPTTGFINLQNLPEDLKAIQIVNVLGKNVAEFKPSDNINLTMFPPGNYFINFMTTKSIITQKIIKE